MDGICVGWDLCCVGSELGGICVVWWRGGDGESKMGIMHCLLDYSLLTAHYVLRCPYAPILATHSPLPTPRSPLPTTVCCTLPPAHYLLLTTHCTSLNCKSDFRTSICVLPYYLLLTTYCLLLAACYLLLTPQLQHLRKARNVRLFQTYGERVVRKQRLEWLEKYNA